MSGNPTNPEVVGSRAFTADMEEQKRQEEEQQKPDPIALALTKQKELGSAIVTEASKRYDEQRRDAVIGEVQRLMAARDEASAQIEKYQNSFDWFTRKLAAIEAGAFKFSTRGEIVCDDPELLRANY